MGCPDPKHGRRRSQHVHITSVQTQNRPLQTPQGQRRKPQGCSEVTESTRTRLVGEDLSKAGSWRCWGWHGGRRAPLGEQRAAEHQPKRNRANISVRLFPAWHSGTASKLGRQHFSWTWGHHAAPESPVGSFPSPRSGIEDGGKQNCPCGSSSAVNEAMQ